VIDEHDELFSLTIQKVKEKAWLVPSLFFRQTFVSRNKLQRDHCRALVPNTLWDEMSLVRVQSTSKFQGRSGNLGSV
jgi:hypothetical protein